MLFLIFPERLRLAVAFFAVAAAAAGFHLQFLALDADGGAAGDGVGDENVGADGAFPADDSGAAQNGGAGVDGHMVFDGGVTLLAPQTLTASGSGRPGSRPGRSSHGHR